MDDTQPQTFLESTVLIFMSFRRLSLIALLLLPSVWGGVVRAASERVQLQGAGATFPYPLYSKWFDEFQKSRTEVEVNYQSIGSGGGIRQLLARTVDFGASDAPMKDSELAKSSVPILHVPTVLGAVVLAYHLPGLPAPLRLTPEVIAALFMGQIEKWTDPRISALNPGIALPDLHVIPVYRSDGSGTTAVFTDYLTKRSAEFKASVGAGKAVRWPTGLGGKGNEGVTGVIKQTPGAVGYVEYVFASSLKLAMAQVRNAEGAFVAPSPASVTAAAESSLKLIPADFRVSITDARGKGSYPISSFTYLLVYQTGAGGKTAVLKDLLLWALDQGQVLAPPLNYAPLPRSLLASIRSSVRAIREEQVK